MTAAFWVTTLVIVATPGTGALYTLSAGLSHGARAAVTAALGSTLGVVPHMLAAITGLAAVMAASAVAFSTIKYLGVAYLLWMAWGTWRDRSALTVDADVARRSTRAVITSGVLINLLNPKLTIFFFAFLPGFVDADGAHPLAEMLLLSGIFMLVTFVVFAGYGLAASAVRDRVLRRPRIVAWMRRSFAGTYVVLAGRLALADR